MAMIYRQLFNKIALTAFSTVFIPTFVSREAQAFPAPNPEIAMGQKVEDPYRDSYAFEILGEEEAEEMKSTQ